MPRIQGKRLVGTAALALSVFLSATGTAQANLVTNGGFETGTFSGWTPVSLDPVWDTVYDGAPHDGQYAGSFGHPDAAPLGTISQTLATVAGMTYDISFWLADEADPTGAAAPNYFEFDWGGSAVVTMTNAAAFGYKQFNYQLTASSNSTELAFGFYHGTAFWDLDSVQVDATSNSVPEPTSLVLVGLGVAGVGLTRRRRTAA